MDGSSIFDCFWTVFIFIFYMILIRFVICVYLTTFCANKFGFITDLFSLFRWRFITTYCWCVAVFCVGPVSVSYSSCLCLLKLLCSTSTLYFYSICTRSMPIINTLQLQFIADSPVLIYNYSKLLYYSKQITSSSPIFHAHRASYLTSKHRQARWPGGL